MEPKRAAPHASRMTAMFVIGFVGLWPAAAAEPTDELVTLVNSCRDAVLNNTHVGLSTGYWTLTLLTGDVVRDPPLAFYVAEWKAEPIVDSACKVIGYACEVETVPDASEVEISSDGLAVAMYRSSVIFLGGGSCDATGWGFCGDLAGLPGTVGLCWNEHQLL